MITYYYWIFYLVKLNFKNCNQNSDQMLYSHSNNVIKNNPGQEILGGGKEFSNRIEFTIFVC